MIYILLGYIALSWIASSIVVFIPNRYTKVIITLLVIVNPFFIILMLIELAVSKKGKRKVLDKESKEELGSVYEE